MVIFRYDQVQVRSGRGVFGLNEPLTIVQRMCGAKYRHISRKSAKMEQQSARDHGDIVNVYQCPFCHYWHVGRRRVKN